MNTTLSRRDQMALAFANTLLAMPEVEFDKLTTEDVDGPGGLLVSGLDGETDIISSAVGLADNLIETLDEEE